MRRDLWSRRPRPGRLCSSRCRFTSCDFGHFGQTHNNCNIISQPSGFPHKRDAKYIDKAPKTAAAAIRHVNMYVMLYRNQELLDNSANSSMLPQNSDPKGRDGSLISRRPSFRNSVHATDKSYGRPYFLS